MVMHPLLRQAVHGHLPTRQIMLHSQVRAEEEEEGEEGKERRGRGKIIAEGRRGGSLGAENNVNIIFHRSTK